MPTTYSENDTFPEAVTIPSDGDPPDASAWNVALEALLDRTAFIRARALGVAAAASVSAALNAPHANISSRFELDGAGLGHKQSDITDGGGLRWTIGATDVEGIVTQITVFLDGDGGGADHSGTMPASKPTVKVWLLSLADGSYTQQGSTTTDPSTTTGQYEAVHAVTVTGLSFQWDPDAALVLEVIGEHGANSVANALLVLPACKLRIEAFAP